MTDAASPTCRTGVTRLALVTLLAAALALAHPGMHPVAHADPEEDLRAAEERLAEVEEDTAEAAARLDELEADLALAVERYHQAGEELAEVQAAIEERHETIAALETGIAQQSESVGTVVRSLYQGTVMSGLETVISAGDAAEAQRRLGYLSHSHRAHQEVLETFASDQRRVEVELAALEEDEARAAEIEDERAAQAEEIEERVAAQESEIAALNAQLGELEEERRAAEQAVREEEERREAERLAQEQREQEEAEQAREVAARADRGGGGDEASSGGSGGSGSGGSGSSGSGSSGSGSSGSGSSSEAGAPSSAAAAAVAAAESRLGSPYQWGAAGPDRFDCSGLTSWAWRQAGVEIPRSSGAQYNALPKVSRSNLQPGDLVFFGSPIHHVGMYVGGGKMIEAPYTGEVVRYRSIDRSDYVGAARPGG